MTTSLDIEVLFSSSKTISPTISEVKMGKYQITTIPTNRTSLTDTKENWILKFKDVWKENQMHSNPYKEAEYLLSFLSLLCEARIQYLASKSNGVQSEIRQTPSSYLDGNINGFPQIEESLQKLTSMDSDMLRQFLRSCSSYRISLSLIDDNPTLSFFLLVTSIEAISGKVIQKSDRINFREFILRYIPTELRNQVGNDKIFVTLINEAYNMRCAFTHGGANISGGSQSADQSNRIYIKHYVGNKEVFSPGLKWFEKVVRAVLINFLAKQDILNPDETKLSELSREEAVLYMKVAKDGLLPGRIVTANDLDLDAE